MPIHQTARGRRLIPARACDRSRGCQRARHTAVTSARSNEPSTVTSTMCDCTTTRSSRFGASYSSIAREREQNLTGLDLEDVGLRPTESYTSLESSTNTAPSERPADQAQELFVRAGSTSPRIRRADHVEVLPTSTPPDNSKRSSKSTKLNSAVYAWDSGNPMSDGAATPLDPSTGTPCKDRQLRDHNDGCLEPASNDTSLGSFRNKLASLSSIDEFLTPNATPGSDRGRQEQNDVGTEDVPLTAPRHEPSFSTLSQRPLPPIETAVLPRLPPTTFVCPIESSMPPPPPTPPKPTSSVEPPRHPHGRSLPNRKREALAHRRAAVHILK